MSEKQDCPPLEGEDMRAALREMKTYVDVTEDDLKQIYEIALRHARQRVAAKIPVKEVMTKRVVTLMKDADLHEAARLLSENKISGMPVVDEVNRVIGVISEADLLRLSGMKEDHTFKDIIFRILGKTERPKPAGDRVEHAMSRPAITVGPEEDIRNAARILHKGRIKRLPVVDAGGKLLGVLSREDIVRAMGNTSTEPAQSANPEKQD